MPLLEVTGDPLLTRAQTLAFGYNARGRSEVDPFTTTLNDRYPTAFAAQRRQGRAGKLQPGQIWLWADAQPRLLFMLVRATGGGVTRLRYVDAALLLLARDYRLYGITSIALLPPGDAGDWPLIRGILLRWFAAVTLPVVVYTTCQPGVRADESAIIQSG